MESQVNSNQGSENIFQKHKTKLQTGTQRQTETWSDETGVTSVPFCFKLVGMATYG